MWSWLWTHSDAEWPILGPSLGPSLGPYLTNIKVGAINLVELHSEAPFFLVIFQGISVAKACLKI